LLTESGVERVAYDERRNSIEGAVKYAQNGTVVVAREQCRSEQAPMIDGAIDRVANLMGVVCRATPLVVDPEIISNIKRDTDLLIFTWGNEKYGNRWVFWCSCSQSVG